MYLTANNFYKKFSEKIADIPMDDYTTIKHYTTVIIELLKKILTDDFGLNWSKEYYRLDLCAWETSSEIISAQTTAVGLTPYLWDLKIAIEHENDKKLWLDELVKIVHIHCPLKVVIGYNYCDMRDDEKFGDFNKLKIATDIMQHVKAFKTNIDEEYLVILGNAAGIKEKRYYTFDYRGYLYDYNKQEFIKL